jgi:SAM-dependent methyltransferase
MTTDPAVLRSSAYPDARNLTARRGLYRYQRPAHDLPGIAAGRLAGIPGAVLDVGCGDGILVRRLRADRSGSSVVALDLSAGMLDGVAAPAVAADAARLPFRDGSFAAVLAMHMLYHVPDVDAAVREAARVLAPGGRYLVSTNSAADKAEMTQLWRTATGDALGAPIEDGVSFSRGFPLEQAPHILGRCFGEVTVTRLESVIVVPSVQPVADYFASYLPTLGLGPEQERSVLEAVRRRVGLVIEQDGAFRISCLSGLLVCSGVEDK